jgi:hypothetical protein
VDIVRYFGATTKAPKSRKAAGTSTIARLLSTSAPNQEQPPHVQQQPRTEPQQHPQFRESQEDQTTSGEGEVNNGISRTGTSGSWSTQIRSPQAHGASAAIGGVVTEVGRSHVGCPLLRVGGMADSALCRLETANTFHYRQTLPTVLVSHGWRTKLACA